MTQTVRLQTYKDDLSDFEDTSNSAWPYLLDDFVEYARKNMDCRDQDVVMVD